MINLPNVTLIAVDTAYYDLTRMALEDSCKKLSFAKVIVFTDKPESFNVDEIVKIEAKNNTEAEHILWYEVPKHISTSHVLTIQWDGWVINPHLWDNNWLQYDYIGAPWCYNDGFDVGNGGFSLRSKKLMKFLANSTEFKFKAPEDDTICRNYRKKLGLQGFKWADKLTASHFSFENHPTKSFGFHQFGNWPLILSKEDFEIRKHLMSKEQIKNNYHQKTNEGIYIKYLTDNGLDFGFLKENNV